jgi:hypothetical protein
MNAIDLNWEDDIVEDVTITNATPTLPGSYTYCVYGWDQWFNYNTTGDCATLTIIDDLPPEIDNVRINGSSVHVVTVGTPSVDLTAELNETNTGQSNIGGANYTIDPQNWSSSDNMFPTDGFWDEIMEDANKTIDISSWSPGIYQICVYGWDSEIPQNNNVTGDCAQLNIVSDLPPEIFNVRLNGSTSHVVTAGTPSVNLTAFLDETNTGLSNIGGANYTIGPQMWVTSVNMDPLDGSWDEISEDAWKIIDISTWGVNVYQICVYGWDSAVPQNNNVTGPCAQLTINPADTPPTIDVWEPGGTPGQEYTQGDLISVTWTTNDDNPLPTNPINITYGDSVSGWTNISLNEMDDSVYSWNTSNVQCPGTYWMNLTVYDSIGQTTYDWGNNSFSINCPQTAPPVIESIDAIPAYQTVGNQVTISALVTDPDTNLEDLTVRVQITGPPDGNLIGIFDMQLSESTGRFEYSASYNIEGTYSYVILATDPEDNSDIDSDFFHMTTEPPPPPPPEYNWKPVIALAFAMILLFLGLVAAFRRPIGFKGILQRDRLLTFLGGVLPFVIAEAATGVVSLATGALSIPPMMGAGLVVDVAILIIGILIILAILMKGKPVATYGAQPPAPEPRAYQPPPPPEGEGMGMENQEIPAPSPPEEGSIPPRPDEDTGVPPSTQPPTE